MSAAIAIKNANKSFGIKHALNDVSLEVAKGSIFGFLGPNGAGKTTMIRAMMDFVRLNQGEITLLGKDSRLHSVELKSQIGYLSSDMQLHPHWSAKEHIEFLGSIKGKGSAYAVCKRLNLDIHARVSTLSSGNKQKLSIALAFLGTPKLLILDEPTRGLDPLLQNELYMLLKNFAKNGGTVFFSSHNLGEVQQLCTNVAVIRNGQVVVSESMDDILKFNIHIVKATTKEALKVSDFKDPQSEIVSSGKHEITLKVKSDLHPVLLALSRYTIANLEIRHATLEEAFMEYYSD